MFVFVEVTLLVKLRDRVTVSASRLRELEVGRIEILGFVERVETYLPFLQTSTIAKLDQIGTRPVVMREMAGLSCVDPRASAFVLQMLARSRSGRRIPGWGSGLGRGWRMYRLVVIDYFSLCGIRMSRGVSLVRIMTPFAQFQTITFAIFGQIGTSVIFVGKEAIDTIVDFDTSSFCFQIFARQSNFWLIALTQFLWSMSK